MYMDEVMKEVKMRKKGVVGRFAEVCRRRGLNVNAGRSKVMVMNGEEGLECKFQVDGVCLEHVSEFKYLG